MKAIPEDRQTDPEALDFLIHPKALVGKPHYFPYFPLLFVAQNFIEDKQP
jgi:hypothetical protein